MTTAQPALVAHSGTAALVRGAAPVLVVGVLSCLLGGVLLGRAGFLGALLGSGVVGVVCVTGILVVNTVAWIAPKLSLAFAVSTYVLQLMVLNLFFLAVSASLRDGAAVDVRALGASAMAVVVVWVAMLVRSHVTTRVPVYDLPAQPEPVPARGQVHR